MKPKNVRIQYMLRNPPSGFGEDYIEAENAERPAKIRGSDIQVASVPRPLAEPITSVSRAPHVDHLVADLYSVLLSQTARLREKSDSDDGDLDAADMAKVAKLLDGVVRLTKLQLEREKHDRFDELDAETLAKELEDAKKRLEG